MEHIPSSILERVKKVFSKSYYLSLATCNTEGMPHVATVAFWCDGEKKQFFFVSSPESQHARDLEENPRGYASISLSDLQTTVTAHGIQFACTVAPVENETAMREAIAEQKNQRCPDDTRSILEYVDDKLKAYRDAKVTIYCIVPRSSSTDKGIFYTNGRFRSKNASGQCDKRFSLPDNIFKDTRLAIIKK